MKPPRQETVKLSDIGTIEELTPARDEVLLYLWKQALDAKVPVYYAAVPMHLIQPFQKDYDPRKHPAGRAAIQAITDAWRKNEFQCVWLYPRGDKFILSDDYIIYFAALAGKPDFLPCWILGHPDHPEIKDIQGPISPDNVRKLLGLSSEAE